MTPVSIKESIKKYGGDGEIIAEITFPETEPGRFNINHTYVHESLRGRGIAGTLVQLAADAIQLNEGVIVATCPYAIKWLDENGYEHE